jgi:hypothetical protein
MKKIYILFGTLFILTGCTFFEKINKKSDPTDPKALVTAEVLNIRKDPTRSSMVLFQVHKDSILNIEDSMVSSDWCKISFHNRIGYGSKKHMIPYVQPSNWSQFWIVLGISFVILLIVLPRFLVVIGVIKTQIPDGRYSDGTRDTNTAFGCGAILFFILALSITTAVLWIIYIV